MDRQAYELLKKQVWWNVGRLIRNRREALGMSKVLFAKLIDSPDEAKIDVLEESGSVSLAELFIIASVLGVQVEDLLPRTAGVGLAGLFMRMRQAAHDYQDAADSMTQRMLLGLDYVTAQVAHEYGIPVRFNGQVGAVVKVEQEYRFHPNSGGVQPLRTGEMLLEVDHPITVDTMRGEPFILDGVAWVEVSRDANKGVRIKPVNNQGSWKWVGGETPVERIPAE